MCVDMQQPNEKQGGNVGSRARRYTQKPPEIKEHLDDFTMGEEPLEIAKEMKTLSDFDLQEHQSRITPDFYVDRADPATFVPDPKGQNKSTYLEDREELFDFDAEVEPILQALCGRSLELARIEVVESFEQHVLNTHKAEYKQLRETELLLTQQMEARNHRRIEEYDNRHDQIKAQNKLNYKMDALKTARNCAKDFTHFLKRDTLLQCVDQGILRSGHNRGMILLDRFVEKAATNVEPNR